MLKWSLEKEGSSLFFSFSAWNETLNPNVIRHWDVKRLAFLLIVNINKFLIANWFHQQKKWRKRKLIISSGCLIERELKLKGNNSSYFFWFVERVVVGGRSQLVYGLNGAQIANEWSCEGFYSKLRSSLWIELVIIIIIIIWRN